MSIESDLQARSGNACELCTATENLAAYELSDAPSDGLASSLDGTAYICATCQSQLDTPASIDAAHWQCLSDSMWSEVPAVKVLAWRVLRYLSKQSWAQDLLDMFYMDEDVASWAQAGEFASSADDTASGHVDSNGTALVGGDTVTLIKDLPVKGAGFTAKRGTAVRNISLVPDNPEHIEGRVSGQHIVILTKFVKKSA